MWNAFANLLLSTVPTSGQGPSYSERWPLAIVGLPGRIGNVLGSHAARFSWSSCSKKSMWLFAHSPLWCLETISIFGDCKLTQINIRSQNGFVCFFLGSTIQNFYCLCGYLLILFGGGNLGDEGSALGGSYMVFHWQPELAPHPSTSGTSRFLITTIPSSAYMFDGDINITLQEAGKHICNALSNFKLSIPDVRGSCVS